MVFALSNLKVAVFWCEVVRADSGGPKCGHPISRHGSKASTQDQTRGVSYYMEGVHERMVGPTSLLVPTDLVVAYLCAAEGWYASNGWSGSTRKVDLDWFSSATDFSIYLYRELNVGP
jgi:hypothetical protein